MVDPWSAITRSPGFKWFNKPHLPVKFLLEVLPPSALKVKQVARWDLIVMRTLTVLWCLWLENVCALDRRFECRFMKISKQLIIKVVFFQMRTENKKALCARAHLVQAI